jgi:hypothetical protein
MATKFIIGAPSITGIDANDLVNEFFADSTFPLMIRLQNHLPRNISLPEINVFLKPFDDKAEAKIKSLDKLHRLVSSIEQIAELNKHEAAITVEDLTPVSTPAKPAKVTPVVAPVVVPVVEPVVGG